MNTKFTENHTECVDHFNKCVSFIETHDRKPMHHKVQIAHSMLLTCETFTDLSRVWGMCNVILTEHLNRVQKEIMLAR